MKDGFWIIVNFTRISEPSVMQEVSGNKTLNECLEIAEQLATARKELGYWIDIRYSVSGEEGDD